MLVLAHLAREYGKGPIQIGDIAQKELIPRRFLENILLELKKTGILGSRLGKAGGDIIFSRDLRKSDWLISSGISKVP